MSDSAQAAQRRRPGEDWFTWIVRSEAAAGNANPVLTAAMAEDRIRSITGSFPS
jgi:hypothetical protein